MIQAGSFPHPRMAKAERVGDEFSIGSSSRNQPLRLPSQSRSSPNRLLSQAIVEPTPGRPPVEAAPVEPIS